TNRILVPFCFFIVASLVIEKVVTLPGLKYVVLQPFREPQIINFPVWFLLCLFWVNVIFRLIGAFTRRDVVKFCIVLAIGAIGYVLDSYQIYIPLFLNSAFTAMPFFFVGYILRKFPILYRSKHDRIYLIVSVIVAGCVIWLCHKYGTPFIEIVDNKYNGNIFAIYFVSISMVLALLMICKAIRWLPVISYMGRYSIVILGFHALFPKYVNMLFKLIGVTPSRYIYCLVLIIICWLTIPVCKKLVPSLIAQSDLIRRKEHDKTSGIEEVADKRVKN
ncbi:MAG: acyltransferase family protein, partial [Muribaculaceae bacterium]|nr:acyltransferase family protein [Muribaculaceae bacterium]